MDIKRDRAFSKLYKWAAHKHKKMQTHTRTQMMPTINSFHWICNAKKLLRDETFATQ